MSDPDREGWLRQASGSLGWARRYIAIKDGILNIYNVGSILAKELD